MEWILTKGLQLDSGFCPVTKWWMKRGEAKKRPKKVDLMMDFLLLSNHLVSLYHTIFCSCWDPFHTQKTWNKDWLSVVRLNIQEGEDENGEDGKTERRKKKTKKWEDKRARNEMMKLKKLIKMIVSVHVQ